MTAQKAPALACLLIPLLARGVSCATAGAAGADAQGGEGGTVLMQLGMDATMDDTDGTAGGCGDLQNGVGCGINGAQMGMGSITALNGSTAALCFAACEAQTAIVGDLCCLFQTSGTCIGLRGGFLSPTTSPTVNAALCSAAGSDVVSGTGDPHLSNVRGEHFDIYQPGNMSLLQLPRHAELARTLLLVEADARRMNDDDCSVYFQAVSISGKWTNQSTPIQFLANPHGTPAGANWKEWMRFGAIDLKVVRRKKGVYYLNVYARNVGHSGYEVGGLLGLDDHKAVSKRPRQCGSGRTAALVSSMAYL